MKKRVVIMSTAGTDLKDVATGAKFNLVNHPPKLLLTLYRCKDLEIVQVGAPSPLSTSSGRSGNA